MTGIYDEKLCEHLELVSERLNAARRELLMAETWDSRYFHALGRVLGTVTALRIEQGGALLELILAEGFDGTT